MSSHGISSADERIDAVLRSEAPVQGAVLQGWIAFCEWRKPGGETELVLLGRPEGNMVQLKGYVHSGLLNMVWEAFEGPAASPGAVRS